MGDLYCAMINSSQELHTMAPSYPGTLAGTLSPEDRDMVAAFRARRDEDQRLIASGMTNRSAPDLIIGSVEMARTLSNRVAMLLDWLDTIKVPHEYALPGESRAEFDRVNGCVLLHLRIRLNGKLFASTREWSLSDLHREPVGAPIWACNLKQFLWSWRRSVHAMTSPEGIPL